MIEINDATLTYPSADKPSLVGVSLSVPRGQAVLVCGRSGCGKTSLTRLINGLAVHFDEAVLEGSVAVSGLDATRSPLYELAAKVGSVFQNPRSQFFCVDVTSEIAFGCENLGLPAGEVVSRIADTVAEMEADELAGRNIFKLSGGQKQKVACASVAAMRPEILVLDEPSSNLDPEAMALLHSILLKWRAQGKTIVIAEHRLRWLTDVCDRVAVMDEGSIVQDMPMEAFAALAPREIELMGLRPLHLSFSDRRKPEGRCTTRLLSLRSFEYSYDGIRRALDIQALDLPADGVIAVIGRNGAGKSTLSRCLCGLERRFKGCAMLDGEPLRRKDLLRRSYLVMQDVNHQLFCESVLEEVKLGMDRSRAGDIGQVLDDLGLAGLEDRHPMSLSGGQKQRVAIAAALLAGKDILVLDEPTSGLDLDHMHRTAQLIADLRGKATVLVVTHDPGFILACCTHALRLEDGRVEASFALDASGFHKIERFFNEEMIPFEHFRKGNGGQHRREEAVEPVKVATVYGIA